MTAVLVVGCSILGLVVGWFLDPGDHARPAQACRCSGRPPTTSRRSRRRGGCWSPSLTGALFGATAARFDDSWLLPAYLVLTGALIALAVIDFETYLLPNRIVYPLTVAMLALLAARGSDRRRRSTTTCAA